MWFVDTETFKFDWLLVGINPITQKEVIIVNDKEELKKFYDENKDDVWCMYNGRNYDQYIIKGILLGFNPKEINDFIIIEGKKGWQFSRLLNTIPLNIYDVMPNPPVGLKTLEAFMGNNIHETSVPFDIDRKLTPNELEETISYCRFDVMNTIEVFIQRKGEFDAQMSLLKAFNLPLSDLGKTQAQLAATILGAKKVKLKDEWDIRLPENLQLGKYQAVGDWFLNKDNHHYDAKLEIEIAGIPNTIAWGGLHAGETFYYVCKDDEVILDADIGQMYPNLMIWYDLLSRAVKDKSKFQNILDTSMRLKREGKKKEREPYKRICNIVYGACGDKNNAMYDPLHRNLVCVFGQVLMIDLIDKIEDLIVSLNHNTDGIFFIVKKKNLEELKRRIGEWEERTHLKMEFDEYTKMIQKDVNNYVAVKSDGKIHAKGAYVKDLNDLDYDLPIVNEALRNYMIFGTPVEVTVNECSDFRKFQRIVKLSSKYQWVEHEQLYNPSYTKRGKLIENYDTSIKYDNKAYRVFASKDNNDGRLLKCKDVQETQDEEILQGVYLTTVTSNKVKKDKFGNTPDHCFIENGDIRGMKIPDKLDRQYYIDLAYKRLNDFGLS